MCKNLEIYERVRSVPKEAQKTIPAGKLKGMTDINPMWRIKKLTEEFGPCGIGWVPRIIFKHIEEGANGERIAIVDVALKVKVNGEWSEEISGTGGSMLVNTEKGRLVSSDEAFKMAYTDAISVCCKMLGFGADIYWDKDRTKYDESAANASHTLAPPTYEESLATVIDFGEHSGKTLQEIFKTDRNYINTMINDDSVPIDIKTRIDIINQAIKKANGR